MPLDTQSWPRARRQIVVRGGKVNPKERDWQPRLLVMLEFPSLE